MSTITNVPWPEVCIGDVLTYLDERVDLDDAAEYTTITVKRNHGGLEERERLLGNQILTKKQFRLIPGAFIISRVQCWHQAYAIVPDNIPANMIASSNYDQFAVSPKVDRHFFWWLSHSPYFTETVRSSAFGVVIEKMVFNREAWLSKKIALPLLAEQRRIVARIDALTAPIHEARALRAQVMAESSRLFFGGCEAALHRAENLFPAEPLQRLVDQDRGISYGIVQTGSDVEGGIPTLRAGDLRWFSVNTTNIKRVSAEVASPYRRTTLQGGELLLRIRGGVGNVGVCPPEMIGGNVSREIAVIPLRKNVEPRFAMYLLAAPSNQARMVGHVKGTSYVGINLKDVRTLPLPVPELPEQRRIVADLDSLKEKADALKGLQTEVSAELDALMPSILDKAFKGKL